MPQTVSRPASALQRAGSGPQGHITPVALHQTFRSERPSARDTDATPAGASGTRLLPVRPRAPLMGNPTLDLDPGAAAPIARSTAASAQAVDLPAASPSRRCRCASGSATSAIPICGRCRTRWTATIARTSTYRAPSFLVSALIVVGALELALLAWYAGAGFGGPSGTVTITSTPIGAGILIDGTAHGSTPATLSVAEGVHTLELRSAGPSEVLVMHVARDTQLSRYFDLSAGTTPARLRITTKPAGASVTVDGRPRGVSPLAVEDLNPGSHIVRVDRAGYSLERTINLQAGSDTTTQLTLDAQPPQAASGHGLLMISTPIALQAFEGDRLIGTSQASPWQLRAGRHEVTLVNSAIGFQLKQAIDVEAGQTTGLALTVPSALLSIDVPPDTRLTIDGESLDPGPLKSRPIAPGQHDVIARHPTLGERRLRVTMAAGVPVSLKIDLAK